MAIKEITVFVYLPGETAAVPAGLFTHDSDTEVGIFEYGRRYIERNNAIPVDPVALPMGTASNAVTTNGGLYGAFRDASPDYWGRLVIGAELNSPPESLTEIDFLLYSNATRVGNLDFRKHPESPEPELGPPEFDKLANILHAAEDIESGIMVEPHLIRLLRQGTSMGGARPKCTVEWENGLWIAKFPAKGDTVNIPKIEYATMKLAGDCGIQVPVIRLESIGGKDVFLIKRFDREFSPRGWFRKGFISALSLMQLDEKNRLKWSYVSIAELMRKYSPVAAINELYRRMVFNILARNTDDHPRNHGFLITKDGLQLSPAYDIVPSLTLRGVGTEFDLAMNIGEKGRNATLENALTRCTQFGLSTDDAKRIINEMKDSLLHWKESFEESGLSGKEIDILEPSFGKK